MSASSSALEGQGRFAEDEPREDNSFLLLDMLEGDGGGSMVK